MTNSQIRTRSFSKMTLSPIGPSTRVSSAMSAPGVLVGVVVGLLLVVATDPGQAELHQVVGLGGCGSGTADEVVAQRGKRGPVHDDRIVARVGGAVQGHDRAGEQVDQEVDRRLLLAWEGL